MKLLARNKTTIRYALYEGKEVVTDEHGYKTGQIRRRYSEPVSYKCYVTAARGEAQADMFGVNLNYQKTLVCEVDCPIDENSILWIDKADGEHDYVVVRKAKSLNFITYAIRKVEVSAEQNP